VPESRNSRNSPHHCEPTNFELHVAPCPVISFLI
jgi:hypothetical protein